MKFLGDYHTHTIFSHGKGTIEGNVLRAREIGLKEIAITDHGFRHVTYNVRRTDFPFMRMEVQRLREIYKDITIYLGLETNFCGSNGLIDILPEDEDILDILICGYHKFVRPSRFIEYPRFYYPNFFFDTIMYTPKFMVNRNTNTYIKAIEKYNIDILSHINYGIKIDTLEVARAAAHFGTFVELNGKHINISDSDLIKMAEAGTKFIVDSDAHSVSRIGEIHRPLAVLRRLRIPDELVVNYEKLPDFRSHRAKRKKQSEQKV